MKHIVEIQGRVIWRYFKGESGALVGICDEIGLTVQGNSFTELAEAVDESMAFVIADLVHNNQFDDFMRKRGWTFVTRYSRHMKNVEFRVPTDLVNVGRPQYYDREAIACG